MKKLKEKKLLLAKIGCIAFAMAIVITACSDNPIKQDDEIIQEFAVRLKLKPQIDANYLATESPVIKSLVLKHNVEFYQSCPNPGSTPELLLLYNLSGKGKKNLIINDFFATGMFDKNYLFEYDTVYLCN